jgi:hypothetical protein
MQLIKQLKEAGQDNEWYPTTNIILEALGESIKNSVSDHHRSKSVLDLGAGNGKCLDYFRELKNLYGHTLFDKTYGVEKSQLLINQWSKDHLILGVDFHKTTLLDKEIDVIYCNCPYSEMSAWYSKIIKEAPAGCLVYILAPYRWKNDKPITEALEARKHELEVVGSFSFEDAEDRKARAKVDLVKIKMKECYGDVDPFAAFFEENFKYPEKEEKETFEEKIENNKLVTGRNLIDVLVDIHDREMEKLIKNFSNICELDPELLSEFEITKAGLIESLKQKISSLKKSYWQRLFDGLSKIKERLTKDSRQKIVERMQANTGIEFNRENAYSVVLYVIRFANDYADAQFIDTYEKMVSFANIEGYKSNQRVFKEHDFKYRYGVDDEDGVSHYKLKVGHRIVLENCGGLYKSPYDFSTYDNGLSERAADFISDLLVIARNMGYSIVEKGPSKAEWDDNAEREYHFVKDGKEKVLFGIRCFYNGNCHVRFNQDFILKMNVLYGKLVGWINSADQAAEEVGVEADKAEEYFNVNFRIGREQLLLT